MGVPFRCAVVFGMFLAVSFLLSSFSGAADCGGIAPGVGAWGICLGDDLDAVKSKWSGLRIGYMGPMGGQRGVEEYRFVKPDPFAVTHCCRITMRNGRVAGIELTGQTVREEGLATREGIGPSSGIERIRAAYGHPNRIRSWSPMGGTRYFEFLTKGVTFGFDGAELESVSVYPPWQMRSK